MIKLPHIVRTALPGLAALLIGAGGAVAQECCPKALVDAAN